MEFSSSARILILAFYSRFEAMVILSFSLVKKNEE